MGRDKFAALASRNTTSSSDAAAAPATDGSEKNEGTVGNSITASSGAPRRDKLAALASRAAQPPATGRGNKFAAMAAKPTPNTSDAAIDANETEQKPKDEAKLARIKEKLSKRREILENLDRAEELTCKLLEIAQKTATELQDLSTSPNISELSNSYRSVLQELHPLLSTNTQNLIQPYQNHSNEMKQSMYAARVEMRLARERAQVLKAFTEIANNNSDSGEEMNIGQSNKRPREDA